MSRYEGLIVDFGGVLTTPLQDALAGFAEALGIELQDLVRAALGAYSGAEDDLVTGFEMGRVSEDDFSHAFAARLTEASGVEVPPEGLVGRILGGLRLEEEMMEAVLAARKNGVKTALLSNSWGTSLYPRDRFPGMFDVVVISGEVGLRKPDEPIYTKVIDGLRLPAEACVFVDDHPGHLKTAQRLGMATVLHRTPSATIAELESLLGTTLR